jgi:hypothetical protein
LIYQFFVSTLIAMSAKKKTKTGRPNLPANQAKDVLMQVRLQPAEKQAFSDAALLSGQGLSVWVRDRLRRIARQELEQAGREVPFLRSTF